MDGMDDPPAMRRFLTNRINTLIDAMYIVPQRVGRVPLRLPSPRPANNQVYFIGACNVPIESLDPALTRPGRMGRHIRFRTPIKDDREDIFDFYLDKVAHTPMLDSRSGRDEIARMTRGYSPAMIEQVCSIALTYAHHDGRLFERSDLVEAMTTIESGIAVDVKYVGAETRAVAIHEAGHAAASHVYMQGHGVDPPLDQDARRLARPPPGDREGGALLALPLRAVRRARLDHGRHRHGAGLLRRELERRRPAT